MKGVQQPDNMKRLKAITKDQWCKFAEKYGLEFEVDMRDWCVIKKNGKHELFEGCFHLGKIRLDHRRRLLDTLLFFKNILLESIFEFDYAQNIHDLITELEGM